MGDINQDKIERALQGEGGEESEDVAKALSNLMELLGDTDSYKMFSEVSNREIKHLSVLSSTGDQLMDEFIKEYLLLKVSHNRAGRSELIDVSNAFAKLHELGEGGEDKESILRRII